MDKKRIMIQMPVTDGIRSVLDGRDDVEYERFTELSEENILQHIANYDGAILGGVASFTARIVGNAAAPQGSCRATASATTTWTSTR